MAKKSKLYIDSAGIKRGYYVYVHRDAATQLVFYVGKGHGDRAWRTTSRNSLWRKHVKLLEGDWHAEIIQDDLSEIEAFQIEADLVEKFGGPAAIGGSLSNWIPGGEDPVAITIDGPPVTAELKAYLAAYAEARTFKELSPQERKELAESTLENLYVLIAELEESSSGADGERDDDLSLQLSWGAQSYLYGLENICRDLKDKRISWKEFCLDFEDFLEQLEIELEGVADFHADTQVIIVRAIDMGRAVFARFDSGNRGEAERIAQETSAKS